MKEKPVLPLLVSMALPNVISMLVNSLYNIVDSLFVARISEDAMTALSLVYPIQNFANAIAIGFGIGINAMIALYLGAGDHKKAETAATHGMVLSLMHGILITIVSIVIMPGFLRRFTSDAGLIASGITYSTIVFLFATINMAALAFEKMFQAVGRMKVTMAALIFGCVCNILLDPILIFGLGPVPAMGIAGAALATGIGQLVTLAFYLVIYRLRPVSVHITRKGLHGARGITARLYAIGIPAALNLALPSLLISCLNALAGGVQSGVCGRARHLLQAADLPVSAGERHYSGMRPVIGYNYGAGERERVSRSFSGSACAVCMHYDDRHCAVSGVRVSTDGAFHRKCPDGGYRCTCAAHYLCGISCFGGFGYGIRRTGRTRKGYGVARDFAVPVYRGHSADRGRAV